MAETTERRVNSIARQRNLFALVSVSLVGVLLLNGAWGRVCASRTVLLPTRIAEDSWVDTKGRSSASYLAQLGRDVSDALYTRKPASASEQNAVLYRMVCTEQYESVKRQLESDEQTKLAQQRDLYSVHFPETVKADPQENIVEMQTTLDTFIGDRRTNSERMKVTFTFKMDGGVLKWCGHKEEPVS